MSIKFPNITQCAKQQFPNIGKDLSYSLRNFDDKFSDTFKTSIAPTGNNFPCEIKSKNLLSKFVTSIQTNFSKVKNLKLHK